ncbi:LOW QUALITY PROTEIN: protein LAZ1 homolog 2 [Macadamia integrifolia]|uniref:LOW QUALITY PROTEIN: protein LAZ1 homolog 2 n=1 Tax=Macadamia integrifolia TaxID=60698 RepID=UPI001C4F1319|nr:LOW QUALITY PROTEIN: protein LAZ1 homolog 2 [Macadamia integrifolia]
MVENVYGMASINILEYGEVYTKLHQPAVILGGCFVLVALVLSIHLIFQHLRSYTNPEEQKWMVAVIFMVPVYASESIISLWNPRFSIACDILRNCYESFALYAFGRYLVACLGGEERVMELLECESRKQLSKPSVKEDKPLLEQAAHKRSFLNFFLQPSALGKDLYRTVKFGLVQYMILKTLCAFLAFLLELFGVYGDGEFMWYYGYPYIAAVLNFSQMWALYCLVQFYNVTHQRLQPIQPLAKFISFKAIVFATWWQGVGIAILCALGVLPNDWKFRNGLQDFLICIEMAIAAVAHVFVFLAEPYRLLPISEHGKVSSKETRAILKLEEGGKEEPAFIERTETHVETPKTSVSKSVQDIVVGGGEHVMKDVVLIINQAMEPVEKGVTKIQDKIHLVSMGSDSSNSKEQDSKAEVEYVDENITDGKEQGSKTEVEYVKENITESGSQVDKRTPDQIECAWIIGFRDKMQVPPEGFF